MVLGTSPVAVTSTSDFTPVSSNGFLHIQANIECVFTMKRVHDMTRHTVKYSVQISTLNTAQSFGQFDQMVECSFKNKVVVGLSQVAVTSPSHFAPASSKEFLDIKANIECGFTLKGVRGMTRIYSQMHRTDKFSEHSSILCPVFPNG